MKPVIALLIVLLPKLLHATITMSTPAGIFIFSTTNGALVAAKPAGGAGSVWGSGEKGLWAARFADGSELDASEFSAASPDKNFAFTHDGESDTLQLDYTCAALRLRISATPHPKGLTLAAAFASTS